MWAFKSITFLRERARLFAVTLLATQTALAQSAATVSDADIERAKQSQPAITEQDIERAQHKYGKPSDVELGHAPAPVTPNVDALPQPRTIKPLDLEAVAKGFQASPNAISQAQSLAAGPALLIFVSFSMPRATLERLIDQAARAKAPLLLQGFVRGSLKETVTHVQALIGKRQVAFQIDPQAFDRFAIRQTPTFVLVRDGAKAQPCASGQCFGPDAFVAAAGDVSLDYALEHIEHVTPQFRQDAQRFLKRLGR